MLVNIILIFVFIFLNAIFASSEAALIAVNDVKVESDSNNGNKKATKVLRFIKKPTVFLSAIQIGITMIGFLNGSVASEAFTPLIIGWLSGFIEGVENSALAATLVQLFVTLVLTYFQVVFGELVPKKLALKKPEAIIYNTVGMLTVLVNAMRPLVWLLTKSANGVSRLLGINPNDGEETMTEEEIRMIVVSSGQKGVLDKRESKMIENILDFDDTEVSSIMTHRTELSALDANSTKEQVFEFVKNEQFTRFPVYKDSIDHIVGILHVKDLIKYMMDPNQTFNLKNLLRKPYFIPDSKKTSELFRELQQAKAYIAIVLDEYGGTAGIVTIEDLLEEIVGNIFDEYDEIDEEIKEVGPGVFEIDGLVNIDDVEDIVKAGLPTDDYDTLSGFILGQLGRFPNKGEHVEIDYKNYRFEVLEYTDNVIEKIKITKIFDDSKEETIDEDWDINTRYFSIIDFIFYV